MAATAADIGLIGLAVMGENLVLNMESHGHTVAVFNRTTSKVDDFTNGRAKSKKIVGCHSVKDLVGGQCDLLAPSPRRIDGGIAGNHDEPGCRIARRTVLGPGLERPQASLLKGVFGAPHKPSMR